MEVETCLVFYGKPGRAGDGREDRVFAGELPHDKVQWRLTSEISDGCDFAKNVRLA